LKKSAAVHFTKSCKDEEKLPDKRTSIFMLLSLTDQMQLPDEVPHPAKRIVSLVPSQTELLFSLGLNEEVVGITKFCVHPQAWFKTKKRVGGTKTIDIAVIEKLAPDLVIANKEENVKEQIEALRSIAPVWISDIETIDDAIEMIRSVGTLTGKAAEAEKMVIDIEAGFAQLMPLKNRPRTGYLIWKDPLMVAGANTFIDHIMARCGMNNIFADNIRYPQITMEEIRQKDCELLLLSSEPYPFREKHDSMFRNQLPGTQIELADGEMFSWYGSRLLLAPAYLAALMNRIQV
jgi:ABC-type Fe3+-hydroxamate transport system substrate-binding protein